MKIDEIVIPDELYSVYIDDFVWAKQKLKDANHRQKPLVYNECEIRPLFVIEQQNSKLVGLDVTSQDWSSNEYAVKINEKSYVLCDKVREVDINFDWPLVDFKTKTFVKDKNGNLIIKHQSVKPMSLTANEEQVNEIHEKYNKYIKSISGDSLTSNDFWNLRNISSLSETGNLIIDVDKIRPLTKDELANKFAVSIEHADKGDFKTKEELESLAREIGAERIMFYYEPGDNYSGEYSFLVSDEDVAKELKDKYNQEAYAIFDSEGNYHSSNEESLNNSLNFEEGKKMRRDKYYVVNQDCSDWFTSLKQAVKEIKAGYFGNERTIIYYISSEYIQEYGNDMSQLGIDDALMEFENCRLVKDWRKH